jgi:long-chain acyl-CoA synthetase
VTRTTVLSGLAAPSIPEAFGAAAREHPEQAVILADEVGWTYAELDCASGRIAAYLQGKGVASGDRVGLYCPNGREFAAAYLGILKAGATVVPLNLMLNPRELAFILADAGARALLHHADLAAASATLGGEVPGLGPVVPIDQALATQGEAPPLPDPRPEVAAILYTSGTTGRPKGAMLTHANLIANTAGVCSALSLVPGQDRLLVVLPMFHAFAATVGMLTPLLHGLTLIPLSRFEPRLVSAAVGRYGATVFLGVPSMYSLLLRLPDEDLGHWRRVRFAVSGGAAMPHAVMSAFEARFGFPILEGDGPTECSPVTSVNPPAGPRKAGSIGRPIPGVEMRIAAPDGATLPNGEHGEVCVRGPSVMTGYWGLEAETRASFFGDWFRTGDLGYRDADGYYYLVDRIKDLIIVNGMNVYPRMVEEVLYRHPAVAEAAVVGEPHLLHGEIPIAFVVIKPQAAAEPAELRDWCREHLGRHEVPRRVILVEALPRNAAGKVLKRELRRQGEVERGVDLPAPAAD